MKIKQEQLVKVKAGDLLLWEPEGYNDFILFVVTESDNELISGISVIDSRKDLLRYRPFEAHYVTFRPHNKDKYVSNLILLLKADNLDNKFDALYTLYVKKLKNLEELTC